MSGKLDDIQLLTLSEAADILQVSTRTLQRMIHSGEMPALKVGGQWRVRRALLKQWVENREGSVRATERDGRGEDS
ncbi:MAG: helix-turn-helix domain-containing protein [Deltaproteobacteria bacterium]|nr:helix-turn-helix domain-containing protein [Deltaproteobacteria bacterium]